LYGRLLEEREPDNVVNLSGVGFLLIDISVRILGLRRLIQLYDSSFDISSSFVKRLNFFVGFVFPDSVI
jgi:hypothetical protein